MNSLFAGLTHPRRAAHGSQPDWWVLGVLVPALREVWGHCGNPGVYKGHKEHPKVQQKWVLGQPGAVVGREKLRSPAVIPPALLLVLTAEIFIFSSALSLSVITFPSYSPSSYACPSDPVERSCFRPHWRCCSCLLNTFSSPNTSQTPSCSDKDFRLLFARVHLSL